MAIQVTKQEGSFCGEGLVFQDWDTPEELKVELDKMVKGDQGWLMLPLSNGKLHDFHFRIIGSRGPRFSNAVWNEGDVAWVSKYIGAELAAIMTR